MENYSISDVRPPPAVDVWIIIANYVRKTWFQVAITIIPLSLVFLLASRQKQRQHEF